VYDGRQALVRNPIDRHAIGDRNRLRFDGDGALTLSLQHASPGGPHELNWLPTPAGAFNVVMRLYWPKREIVEGTWKIPPIERVE
jgi:DNA sulfur modification protein DndE